VKLILTHDNADFDAVASLLAAYKLDPTATPVLPLRVNRNVEHFLTLYGEELPFLRRDDLRRGVTVEHVTVVDTQSFSTARGMHRNTPIHFIDHHPLTRELTEDQTFSGDTVGATTTLLVEQMSTRQISIEPLEATLLMLGIYEDTGSLLYVIFAARRGCWSAARNWMWCATFFSTGFCQSSARFTNGCSKTWRRMLSAGTWLFWLQRPPGNR